MSPTLLRHGAHRFFFFSREETRVHVHVTSPHGEAKFWLEPIVSLAVSHGYSARQLRTLQAIVEDHKNAFRKAWKTYFGT